MDKKHFRRTRSGILTLDLKQLRYALSAADFGSFRRAAEASLVKQSTLSRSIQQLEHVMGTHIFERSSSGIRATPAGLSFLQMSRSIIEQIDSLVTTTRANGRGDAGRLAVGFCTSLAAGNLRASLIEFKQRFSLVELATIERSRVRLVHDLRNGMLDVLVVAGGLPFLECKSMPLWTERILVVLQRDHRMAQRETIYWTDLRDQTVLLSQFDPDREFEELLNSKLLCNSDRPRLERHDVSRGVIKSLVSMKLGISLVLESDIGTNVRDLAYRELRDGSGSSCIGFSAIWRSDNDNPVLARFLSLLSERYPSF